MADQKQQENQGVARQMGQTMDKVVETAKRNEMATWAVGGVAGAAVGSIMGPVGAVAGAVGGAVLADQLVDAAGTTQQATNREGTKTAMQGGQSPRGVLQQLARNCEEAKNQMVSQMNHLSDPASRTVYQMAINAANLCSVECNTAMGAIHE